jgi:putative FmdB family regulatory protein
MPLYEYKCDKCGNLFEVMQKFSDEPLETHENCGGAVHRLLSAPALQFKGSGWYITDYAKNGNNKPGSGKSDAGASSNGASGTESSAKSESSTPAATTTSSSSDKK